MKNSLNINTKRGNTLEFLSSTLLFFISMINLFITSDYSKKMAVIIGCFIVFTSILLLFKNRNDKKYILLFGIILYINFSILISDVLTNGSAILSSNTVAWQIFRRTSYEMAFLNSLFVFIAIINFVDSISRRYKKIDTHKNLSNREKTLENKDNLFIFIICCIVILIGLVTGYRDSGIDGNYLSATSTLYEYCIIFLLFAWYYAGSKKSHHFIIILLAIIYIVQAIIYGDRSSAFPMIVLLTILYLKKLSISKLALVSIAGIIAANVISTYRESYTLSDFSGNYFAKYGVMSIASDTVSQSYYTGTSVAYAREAAGDALQYFPDYLIGIIVGGRYGHANVTGFSKGYATNKGGGMVVSDFYFWFGYYGVMFEAVIIGIILAKLRDESNSFKGLWKTCITIMVFRWYLYDSFVFFRSCLFVFFVIYCVFWMLDNLSRRKTQTIPRVVTINKGDNA